MTVERDRNRLIRTVVSLFGTVHAQGRSGASDSDRSAHISNTAVAIVCGVLSRAAGSVGGGSA
jgi:hypothetical protein